MMVDFSDGWFMLPLRCVQLVNSLIVLMCAIAGRVNVPTFASHVGSPEILLGASCVHVLTTITLMLMFYVFKWGGKVAVVAMTVLFEVVNYGLSIASFVNLIYDFDFSTAGVMESVCGYGDTINNPNPVIGCQFYQAGVAFTAVGWFLWTISMTWIISQIHKRVRKAQMAKYNSPSLSRQKEAALKRLDMESQNDTYNSRYPFTNSPIPPANGSKYSTTGSGPSRPLSSIWSQYRK